MRIDQIGFSFAKIVPSAGSNQGVAAAINGNIEIDACYPYTNAYLVNFVAIYQW